MINIHIKSIILKLKISKTQQGLSECKNLEEKLYLQRFKIIEITLISQLKQRDLNVVARVCDEALISV